MAEKAQVGDLIRVVDAKPYEGEEYENGDIYEVLGRFGDGDVGVYVNKKDYFGDDLRLYDREYVIHRKAGEEDAKPKSRRLQKSCRQCGEYLNESHTFARSGYYFCGNYCADLFDSVNVGEEDAPCDDFIVDGCLFEYQDGSVRRAERVTDDWIYADDGKRYKRMFANRVTDVMTTKSYELMEETKAFDESFAKDCETQADRIKRAGTELTDLLVRKNHDYGDSFAKQYEKYGLMSALIRMDDKMRRLETLLGGTDAQVDESIKDSLLDLAGYALLASIEAGKH